MATKKGTRLGSLLGKTKKIRTWPICKNVCVCVCVLIIYSDVKLVFHSSFEASLVASFLLLTQTCIYIYIYKQMGLISDIQIHACDRHRYLVWSSYVIKKGFFFFPLGIPCHNRLELVPWQYMFHNLIHF